MSKTRMLVVHSTDTGPWIPVSRVKSFEVRGAGRDDLVQIELRAEKREDEVLLLKGSGLNHHDFPIGQARARLKKGKCPVTVIAHLERIGRKNGGAETTKRHDFLGDHLY